MLHLSFSVLLSVYQDTRVGWISEVEPLPPAYPLATTVSEFGAGVKQE